MNETTHRSRTLLFVLSVFVCAALIASYAVNTLHARATAQAGARRAAENFALSLSDQASDTFEAINEVLLGAAQRVNAVGLGSSVRVQLRDDFAQIVANMPRIHRLDVIDAQGRFAVSNISATPDWMVGVADRPYFQYHRHHADAWLHISGPAHSRTDHKSVIFATRRLDRADGSFAGLVISPIPFDYFDGVYAHVDTGRLGAITLVADDGTVMMRKPRVPIGTSVANEPLFHDPYRYLLAGSYLTGAGQSAGLVAFHRLGKYPLVVTVALAESEYLHDWFVDALENALTLLVYVLFVLALTLCLNAQFSRTSRAEAELARLALADALTGLANRREFDIVLDREWRQAVRHRRPIAVLMIDVDNFKEYNDAYGHQQGDAVLVAIAGAIAATIKRSTDVAARYGGEEFGVILHDTDAPTALAIAENVRRAVVDLRVTHATNVLGIATISVGAASIIPDSASETSPSILLGAADAALYVAKRAGRNRAYAENCPLLRSS